ncbi:unnamed protein product [Schistocephalus solidus]|uniref:Secreted protein n=1 Tax=Schistocephalus solidus TaxID=70667 RepID=A0A183TQ81_SCHSO|nr:unnamed protein product [Schistocephalus solidus]
MCRHVTPSPCSSTRISACDNLPMTSQLPTHLPAFLLLSGISPFSAVGDAPSASACCCALYTSTVCGGGGGRADGDIDDPVR